MNKNVMAEIDRYKKNWVSISEKAEAEGDWKLEYYGKGAIEAINYLLFVMRGE